MSIAIPQTFTIPAHFKHNSRYRLSDAQIEENKAYATISEDAFLQFIKLSLAKHAPEEKWAVEREDASRYCGWFNIKVNGITLCPKFRDTFITLDNNGSTRTGSKISTQLYYAKELTFAKHGKKMYELITSIIKKNAAEEIRVSNKVSNNTLAVKITKLLVDAGKISLFNRENNEEGFVVTSNDITIYFKYVKGYEHHDLFIISYNPQTGNIYTALNANAAVGVIGHAHSMTIQGRNDFNDRLNQFQAVVKKMDFFAQLIADKIKNINNG